MKRFLGLVCFIYGILIIYIIYNDLLKNFLAPNMQIYIKLMILPLLIMGLVMLFKSDISYKFKISDIILLLPILMLVLSGDARLSTSLATNKMMKVDTSREVVEEVKKVEVKNDYDFTNVDFDVVDASYVDISNYLSFAPSAKKYIGKTIRVRGFILNDDNIIPSGYKALGKYNITCCAADALFVGFYIKDNGVLINNYIPCKRDSDDQKGFYETVSGNFIIPTGTFS